MAHKASPPPSPDAPPLLGSAPATRADRTRALIVAVILVAAFALTAPWADRQLARVPAFVPIYNAVVIVLDLITALLLHAQARQLRERSFLALAAAFLFTPPLMAAHAASFPDAFVPGPLVGTDQTTAWLWMGWHGLFPFFIIAYAVLAHRERRAGAGPPVPVTWRAMLLAGGLTLALSAGVIALTTAGQGLLPPLMFGDAYRGRFTHAVLTAGWLAHLAALALLVALTRVRRLIDLWIGVALLALLIDLALSAILVNGRYRVGFYMGRVYGLLGASFVLSVLLRQTVTLYAQAVGAAARLRAGETRQAFLVRLADTLAPLGDPLAVQRAAARLLGEHLGALRVSYTEIRGDEGVVTGVYAADGAPPAPDRFRIADYVPPMLDDLRRGETVCVPDVAEDGRFDPGERARFAAVGAASFCAVPLVKGGEWVATLSALHSAPRAWAEDDLALLRDVAERTWAAVERAHAEAALRESDARFRLAEEAATGFVYDWDVATGAVARSDGMARVLGYTPADLVGRAEAWGDLIHPEDRAPAEATCRRAIEGGAPGYVVDYRVQAKDGRTVHVLDRGLIVRDAAGKATRVVGSTVDVTDRRRAEAALRVSEERFRALAEAVPQIVWTGPDDRVDYVNSHWFAYTGLPPDADLTATWPGVVHPDDRPAALERFARAMATGEPYEIEYRLRRHDGVYRWHLARAVRIASVGRWFGFAIDITDRRAAAEAAEQARQYAESIVETLHEPLLVLNPDLTVKGVNPAFYTHFHVDPAETIGRKVYHLGNGQWDIPALRVLLEDVLPDSNVFNDYEVTHDFEGIGRRVMLVNARRLDHVQLILLGIRDITERARAEAALRASEERYRTLFASIDEGYLLAEVIFDEKLKPVDIFFVEANPVAVRLAGRDFTGRRLREVGANYEEEWFEIYGRVALTGTPVRAERYAAPHGRWFEFHVSRVGGPESRRVAVVFQDVTERKHREAGQAFLLKLSDALRLVTDPVAVQAEACRVLGEHLGVDRAYYVEIDEAAGTATVRRDYLRGTSPSIAGVYRLVDYGWNLPIMREGRTIVFDDAARAPMVPPADRPALTRVQIVAQIAVPVVKAGALVGCFCVTEPAPRAWSAAEAELVRETGERTWAAVEQAKAEAALRASEERYRALFESMDEAYAVVEMIRDEAGGKWADFRFVEVNPAFVQHTGMEYPVGKTATQLLGTPNPRWAEVYGRVAETGESVRVEEREPTLDRTFDLYIFRLGGPGSRRVAVLFTNVTERRRAEAALRASEERLRLALAAARMGTWTWDVASDRQTRDANLNRLLGLEAVETTQPLAEFFDHVHPDERAALRAAFDAAVRHGRPLRTEFRVVWPDGTVRWLRDQGDVFGTAAGRPDGAATHLAGACVDVTERREAEDRLRAGEERLRAVAANLPNGAVFMVDRDLRYRLALGEALTAAGFRPEDLEGKTVAEAIPPDLVGPYETHYRAALAGAPFKWEHASHGRHYMTHGVPLRDAAGAVYAVLAVSYDITDRKRAEDAVREHADRLRLLVENVRDHAVFTLDPAGRVTSWNPGAERIFGYTEPEILGRDGAALFTPEERARGEHEDELATAARTGQASDDRWQLRKDGARFWANGVTSAMRGADGSLRGFIKVLRDDTAAKLLSEQRDRLLAHEKAALHEAQQAMVMKDEFLAVVSHELRTPLSAILLWTKMLRAGVIAPEQQREGLDSILRSAEAQKQLIEDLLDVSRMISGQLRLNVRETDLAAVVRAAVDAVRVTAEAKGVRVAVAPAPEPAPVRADPDRIQQVVWNLVNNAVKFTDAGGGVTVRLRALPEAVEVSVADTGHGIAPDFLPHVFERFRQADASSTRVHGGLGLGLAISRQLVELHGGSIRAESPGLGKGATFTVRLPRAAPRREAALAPPAHARHDAGAPWPRPSLTGLRILLVEDDAETRAAIEFALRRCGAEVAAADSAGAATDAFRAALAAAPFAALISDIGMPEANGLELIARLRQLEHDHGHAPTPAIALTAYARDQDRDAAIAAGFDTHISKPVDPVTLIEAIALLADLPPQ